MRFLRFQPKFGHAASHCLCSKICPKLPKFAIICPKTKLWNTTKNRDFRFFQNQKFLHVEEALEHVFTVWIFNPIIFHMLFLLSKNGLCMWISAYPFGRNGVFFKVPNVSWIWDFVDMYLTHLGTRIWSPIIHNYYKNRFFWPPKLLCTPWAKGKKLFFSTLNLMILQMVWNECVRFGGHINIQVSFKILRLEVLKKALILHNPTCFQEGLFWSSFGLTWAQMLRG
jgi:hypothetical protein